MKDETQPTVILHAPDQPTARRRAHEAAKAYCSARGWPDPNICEYQQMQVLCPEGDPEAGGWGPAFQLGGIVLVDRLTDLERDPDALLRALNNIAGRGCELHSLELGGNVMSHIEGIRVGLRIAAEANEEMGARLDRAQKNESEAWRETERFQREFVSRWVQKHGVPKSGLASFDEVLPLPRDVEQEQAEAEARKALEAIRQRAEQGDATAEHQLKVLEDFYHNKAKSQQERNGEAIREARLARGWTLDTLASASGISRTQVHRIEAQGKTGGMREVADVLGITEMLELPPERGETVKRHASLAEVEAEAAQD